MRVLMLSALITGTCVNGLESDDGQELPKIHTPGSLVVDAP